MEKKNFEPGKELNIYEYSNYRTFLISFYNEAKKRDQKYSVRYLSRRLNLNSPSTLNMILRGHRNPGYELIERLSDFFQFSSNEKKYFKSLVALEKNNLSDQEKINLGSEIQKLNPKKDIRIIDNETFSIISNWYFFAFRQIIRLKEFKNDIDWIYKIFNKKVTRTKIKDALKILEKKGLIKRDGLSIKTLNSDLETSSDVPSEALKQHHEQMMDLAKAAIREYELSLRDISGTTFNIDLNDLPQMKKELNEFRRYFYRKFEKPQGEATYQICIQLFPLTNVKTGGWQK